MNNDKLNEIAEKCCSRLFDTLPEYTNRKDVEEVCRAIDEALKRAGLCDSHICSIDLAPADNCPICVVCDLRRQLEDENQECRDYQAEITGLKQWLVKTEAKLQQAEAELAELRHKAGIH